nr:doublesex- and mab-3-related transcription factor C1-like isoform X2 [Peromyscus maniculatus bairdii]XP_042125245.1 doublesex- and mab-3-related transcription factor C1-like isoform X2 [Peromyscus maniculatus bairdii]
MDADPNSHMDAKQCPARSPGMNGQQGMIYQPGVLRHTVPQQENSQVPVLLNWPTAVLPVNGTSVTLSPQMLISFSCDHCQPITVPYLFSNVLLQPCINTAPPVPQAQVLVSSISFQGPANANHAPVIANQINNVSNQGPEVYNPVPEGTTQLSDVSNQGALSAELDRQKVLDAAEALLILHNSPQAWQDPCSTSGADGE